MTTTKIIHFISPDLKISENVAIVGSSSCLSEKNFGLEIDKFDDVIRFNRAPTDGYTEIVGSKTTIRALNSHVALNKPVESGWTGQDPNFITSIVDTKILVYTAGNIDNNTRNTILNVLDKSNSIFEFKHNEHESSDICPCGRNKDTKYFYSIGTLVVSLCVKSGIVPHVFGFDLEDNFGARGHYWENRPPPGPCHNISLEKKYLKDLFEQKKIIIYK